MHSNTSRRTLCFRAVQEWLFSIGFSFILQIQAHGSFSVINYAKRKRTPMSETICGNKFPISVQVIPIPIEVVSHSLPFPFLIPCFIPIPMGFPRDSHSHWESHSMDISTLCTCFSLCIGRRQ